MGIILTIVFTLLSAYIDKLYLKKQFIFNHTIRFVLRGLIITIIAYLTQTNIFLLAGIFYLLFDYSLNIMRGIKWNYVGNTAKIDITKHKIFGRYINILDPLHKIVLTIITIYYEYSN
jgi:hypothetical protein